MKNLFTAAFFLIGSLTLKAQETKLYNPGADAEKDIEAAIKKAKADKQIDSVINSSFVWYHLNYSKENENKKLFAKYGYAQRFGFPVFIILDGNGNRIHTQNSEYLEDGKKSYNKVKVQAFLEMWAPRALNPKMYGD